MVTSTPNTLLTALHVAASESKTMIFNLISGRDHLNKTLLVTLPASAHQGKYKQQLLHPLICSLYKSVHRQELGEEHHHNPECCITTPCLAFWLDFTGREHTTQGKFVGMLSDEVWGNNESKIWLQHINYIRQCFETVSAVHPSWSWHCKW